MAIILLDIGNVLLSVDFEPFCRSAAHGIPGAYDNLWHRYCDGPLKERLDRGLAAPGEFLGMLADDPETADMPPAFFRRAWQRIFTPVQGSADAVRRLRERHQTWIMSDTDPLHFAHLLDTYPLLRGHDRYFLSYEHGLLKRDTAAFRHVLESSGRAPGEFVLIDDRPANIAACRQAGMGAILFDSWPHVLDSPLLFGRSDA
jgi:HAD superfamily hydrolase (TIGR01509 family)